MIAGQLGNLGIQLGIEAALYFVAAVHAMDALSQGSCMVHQDPTRPWQSQRPVSIVSSLSLLAQTRVVLHHWHWPLIGVGGGSDGSGGSTGLRTSLDFN